MQWPAVGTAGGGCGPRARWTCGALHRTSPSATHSSAARADPPALRSILPHSSTRVELDYHKYSSSILL
eukprot:scaffold55315_cov29-Tisochrysis_lutea.AAC.8